jgi:hypothetical protein
MTLEGIYKDALLWNSRARSSINNWRASGLLFKDVHVAVVFNIVQTIL